MATSTTTGEEIGEGVFARDADQDEDSDDLVIVLERMGTPVSEIVVYEEPNGDEKTVDEWNPDHDPDAEGIKVVYRDSVDYKFDGEWTVSDVMAAFESGELTESQGNGGYGVKSYTMPVSRLTPVGGSDA
ncbi:hypothetical protein [Halorhabdus rudnickae]|uniref:hypothetical protein n=1 Tax=Halorhabdus rudnickae TaxID=1775544 RepID=UPI0010835907|nr:hypothetical protein [Halorhabdus rudnickae]